MLQIICTQASGFRRAFTEHTFPFGVVPLSDRCRGGRGSERHVRGRPRRIYPRDDYTFREIADPVWVSSVQTMASISFRDSMSSLGWTRRDADVPVRTGASTPFLSKLQSYNPFGRGGYVQLPTHEAPGAPLPAPSRREEEESFFACESSDLIYFVLNPTDFFKSHRSARRAGCDCIPVPASWGWWRMH